MERVTEENISELKDGEIFVFGSNCAGRHGAGAAKTAMKWGAKYGQGEGLQGKCYALPTMNAAISNHLSLVKIQKYVDKYIQFAIDNPELTFLTTAIGTNLAGYTVKDIAPLFKGAIDIKNIFLPKSFWKILGHE